MKIFFVLGMKFSWFVLLFSVLCFGFLFVLLEFLSLLGGLLVLVLNDVSRIRFVAGSPLQAIGRRPACASNGHF